jgi:hypothetical protein
MRERAVRASIWTPCVTGTPATSRTEVAGPARKDDRMEFGSLLNVLKTI